MSSLPVGSADGPGLASAGPGRVVSRRTVRLLSVLDGWWARVLERADIVSEGQPVWEPGGQVYYGSTSLYLCPEPRPESIRRLDLCALTRLLLADPHARARLVRLARREAVARAPGPLGIVRVELSAQPLAGATDGGQGAPRIEVALEVAASLVDTEADSAVQ